MNRRIIAYRATHYLLRSVAASTAVALFGGAASAQTARDDNYSARVERAAEVLDELVALPDKGPPRLLLGSACCVAVIPGVVQVGRGIGGQAGFGLESCRTPHGWSLPTFVGLEAGSLGFRVGEQSADVVLVFANENVARRSASTFDIGADASVVAGPVEQNASAETDYRRQSRIFSYSRSMGVFASVSLSDTRWEIEHGANDAVYRPEGGHAPSVEALLTTDGASAPHLVMPFLASLERNAGPGTYKRASDRR